ncbi:endonuclease 5 [Natronomonas pharaonis DSM 2160]|uniref:Endonuclease V n=1 Tax=Natronomonas pharaonis (strain ATCC 35678 / DSM 2160 / CIP 103997 / JCM 8858 / NBRC 14720 / NCIMB 2260 / Gabara) TaxID=348780 RepID=NFI_NATPD|nr:endonuclease V [Natronomonas pharaonis]Q3IT64.1 RecName: Full=Endonuclease V; AltName: Full=Deoxyinosine 3'endonuclease; AltName: Full=Deoxyribonuclease V; Short=DNase V [Natronomonas pharaonis DSM 2160]CAI48670.1 endonuclease 5 [Natronomonas pharaonis DSM 2160]
MELATPRFRPDPSLSREAMETLQHDIAAAASFENEASPSPAAIRDGDALVAGVDQAFLDDRAVSAVVVLRGGEVVAREHAVTPLSIPYIPGLLAFREGGPIIDALSRLDVEPDLLVVDGSGRIHFREAGLATHAGLLFDVPAVGVAKRLLCGEPSRTVASLPEGTRVPIEADDSMTAADGTVVGYAYQSRQYPDSKRINPLYISPGHRLCAETAVDCVAACGGEYKLPRPTRLADGHADDLKARYGDG